MKSFVIFVLLGVLTVLVPGCALNGRDILLKEFQANSGPVNASSLKGKSVYVARLSFEPCLQRTIPVGKAEDPQGFKFVEMNNDQKKLWDAEFRARLPATKRTPETLIGNLRNGYGIVMSNVYYMNHPGDWMKQAIELELQARGATLASTPEAADLVVSGDIIWLKIDMYMSYSADLITRFTLAGRGRPPVEQTVHTDGSRMAWTTTGFEYYQPIRMALQKSMVILLPEIEKNAQP